MRVRLVGEYRLELDEGVWVVGGRIYIYVVRDVVKWSGEKYYEKMLEDIKMN